MAKQTWTISGTLKVEESDISDTLETRPLANVEVEVLASNFGPYASWGTVRTDAKGNFSLRKEKDKSKRKFKIKVRFEDAKLKVVTGFLTNPINLEGPQLEVFEHNKEVEGPRIDIGTRTFKAGGSGDLGVLDNRRQAATWYAVRKLIDELVAHDPWNAFAGKVHVVYPANSASGISYTNGVTRCAYIHKGPNSDQWSIHTVFHEVMHLWNYDHNHGMSNWFSAILWDFTTHGYQEEPYIAFHEGFSEFAADALMAALWGSEGHRKVPDPWTRKYLVQEKNLSSNAMIERNDDGVLNGLRVLMAQDFYRLRFGTATHAPSGVSTGAKFATRATIGGTCPTPPNLTIWDILSVFKAHPNRGWDTDWQVGVAEYGLLRFYDRATDILPSLTKDHKALMIQCLEPTSDVEPNSACGPLTMQRAPITISKGSQ